jgi:hypothetical protein
MRIPYGYIQTDSDNISVCNQQADTIRWIYELYLQGQSLGGIMESLRKSDIYSPTGNTIWSRAAVDKILSNGRYVPSIISEKQFWQAQIEIENRTNLDEHGRKTARYNSQNVLSGLLVCGECGKNFRRITRPSGDVVWRCADRVENGKHAVCSNTRTVSDAEIKRFICEQLELNSFDECIAQDSIDTITISKEGISLQTKSSQSLEWITLQRWL